MKARKWAPTSSQGQSAMAPLVAPRHRAIVSGNLRDPLQARKRLQSLDVHSAPPSPAVEVAPSSFLLLTLTISSVSKRTMNVEEHRVIIVTDSLLRRQSVRRV